MLIHSQPHGLLHSNSLNSLLFKLSDQVTNLSSRLNSLEEYTTSQASTIQYNEKSVDLFHIDEPPLTLDLLYFYQEEEGSEEDQVVQAMYTEAIASQKKRRVKRVERKARGV